MPSVQRPPRHAFHHCMYWHYPRTRLQSLEARIIARQHECGQQFWQIDVCDSGGFAASGHQVNRDSMRQHQVPLWLQTSFCPMTLFKAADERRQRGSIQPGRLLTYWESWAAEMPQLVTLT